MSDFEPGFGWINVQFTDKVPTGTVAFREDDGSWSYWIREVPVPPLPTAPYTVIRPVWTDNSGAVNALMLTAKNEWMLIGDDLRWLPDDLPGLITSFEVLSEPRAVTAKAVIDRVSEMWTGDERIWDVAREFGVTDE